MSMKKLAVVLFNLGGPDSPDAVQPFLFNLFNDPAIIHAPGLVRWFLAKLISARRAPVAREIYSHMGGRSPILQQTQDQARALESVLKAAMPGVDVQVFVSMRYWHPFSDEIAPAVKSFSPDRVVLLPLYPQFSTTTTASSLDDWHRAAARAGLDSQSSEVCCWPTQPGFVRAQAQLVAAGIKKAGHVAPDAKVRVLFSAHGLPVRIVERTGDPYPAQVEAGATAIVEAIADAITDTALDDWKISYQSRVGPMQWIGPSTEDEIKRAGADGVALVVVPLAFVSEHSETLVELDIEYAHVASRAGVAAYVRVPTVTTHEDFIKGLSDLVGGALASDCNPSPGGACARICGASARACPAKGGG